MTWLLIVCGLVGLLLSLYIPTSYPPRSPIGEAMPARWRPHPRTVVHADPYPSE